jgi:Subtilase family
MDPALQELLEGNPEDEIEVIIRLHDREEPPSNFRVVSRFGPILTGRVLRKSIRQLWSSPQVASVKAPRIFQHDAMDEEDEVLPTRRVGLRRARSGSLSGRGTIIGIVDWGLDFTCPSFLLPDGGSRIVALWDQTAPPDRENNSFGYGKVHLKPAIDAALRSSTPFTSLGYHPAIADPGNTGSHGTHVLDIAGGNGAIGPAGMAPGAMLMGVHLSADPQSKQLGNSCRLLEAIAFLDAMAGSCPLVINLSMGKHCGPHNGRTLVEQALDYLTLSANPRLVVQSAGNYYHAGTHTSGMLFQDETTRIGWDFPNHAGHSAGQQELEVWYSGKDDIAVSLVDPNGRSSAVVLPGGKADCYFSSDESLAARIYNRKQDPNTGFNNIHIYIYDPLPGERWQIVLEGKRIADGWYHGWIERVAICKKCQSTFDPAAIDKNFTTGTISNGQHTLSIGAYDDRGALPELSYFSSAGPTVDFRAKPDFLAPGVKIAAARSSGFQDLRSPGQLCVKSGTSMATPVVTGLCAIIAEAMVRSGATVSAPEIITVLKKMPRPFPDAAADRYRTGLGILDTHKLSNTDNMENSLIKATGQESAEDILDQLMQKVPVDKLDGQFFNQLRNSANPPLNVIGYPRQPLRETAMEGDIILRYAPGERLPLHASVIALGDLVLASAGPAAGFTLESDLPGAYVHVIEEGAFPIKRSHRFARRLLDRNGFLPAGQLVIRPWPAEGGSDEAEDMEGMDEAIDENFDEGTEEGFFDTITQGISDFAQNAVTKVHDFFVPPTPAPGSIIPPAAPVEQPSGAATAGAPVAPASPPVSPVAPVPSGSSSTSQLLSDDYPVRQLTLNQARDILQLLQGDPASGLQLDSPPFNSSLRAPSHRTWTRHVKGGPDVTADETHDVPRTYMVRPSNINGVDIKYMNTATGGILLSNINNLDPRMTVFLYKFTRWLKNTWGVDTLYHMGIGHGSGAEFDCHNTGRALDLGGLKGTKDGTPYELFVLRDWGRRPARMRDGRIYFRLSPSDGLVYSLFKDVYRYIVTQLSDTIHYYEGPKSGSDLDNRLFHDDVPIPSNFIIHPDHPDSSLRAAHINHIHCQVGPTSLESTPPMTVDSSASQLEEGIGDILQDYEQKIASGLSGIYQGLSSFFGGSASSPSAPPPAAPTPVPAAAGALSGWPTAFGKGDGSYDRQVLAWVTANRSAVIDFPQLGQAHFHSKTPNGFSYEGHPKTDPKPDWKPADPAQAPVYEAIREELFTEGGASSINTYDDQILTIGWGFSVKNELGRSVLSNDIQASAAFGDKLLSVGFFAVATTVYYIDTAAGVLLKGEDALKKVKWDQKVLSQLIYAMEAESSINVDSQARVFKQYRMKSFPQEGFQWPLDSVRLAMHLSHWLPVGIRWAGIKNSGGDVAAIAKHFCRNVFDYQQKKNKVNYFMTISKLPNGALFVDDSNRRFHMGNNALEKAGRAGTISTMEPSAFDASFGSDPKNADSVFLSFKNKIYLLN